MKQLVLLLFALLTAGACTCCVDHSIPTAIGPGVNDNKPEGKQPGGHKNALPVMGSRQVISVAVEELSGLCMNRDTTAFWAVGDDGDLCRVSFSGSVTPAIRTHLDLEGISIDPATGDLYLAVEGDQMVCRVAAPGYDTIDTLFFVKEALERDFDNSGLEGIAFYKDSLLFVGSQEDALLWAYRLDGTPVSRISLRGETPLIEEIGGLFYDADKNWLWISDSDAAKIFLFDVGTFDLLTYYDVPFIDNAESICVDRKHDCVWVGSDEDHSKLYRLSYTF